MIDLTGLPQQVAQAAPRVRTAPKGDEPGVRWNGREGEISTEAAPAAEEPKSWDDLIIDWGLDPTEVEVVPGSVEIRAWDANFGRDPNTGEVCKERLRYYKARLQRRTFNGTTVDYDDLVTDIRKWKPFKRLPPAGDLTLLVNLADWQIGSADGRGTEAIKARVLDMIGEVCVYVKALRKIGYKIGRIHVQGLGDLFEGCTGHYAMQAFTVQLDRRQQTRVVRRLLKTALTTWAQLAEVVTVGTVPGNHGEHRNGSGKAFTNLGDNDDVAVFEAVAEMFQENPELRERVLFTIPDQDLVQVFDLSGTIVAFAHAHQATRNGGAGKLPPAQAKVLTWWKDQSFGLQRPGDADLLVTGHYHHFSIVEHGHRTHLQCPAMDDGSIWFTNQTGLHSRAGTLAMLVGTELGTGGYGAAEILGSGLRSAA